MSFSKSAAAAVSIAYNLLLLVAKLVVAVLTGSVAILSEALHSVMDLVAAIVAFVTVRKADEPADTEHPYGHHKLEHLAAGFEGLLLVIAAGIVGYEAVSRLVDGAEVEKVGIGITVIAFSVVGSTVVGLFLRRQSKRHSSAALEGDAAHLLADAWTSVAVLIGLALVELTGEPAFDSVVAILISALIAVTGIRILIRAGRALLDESAPAEELDRIEEVISRTRTPEMVGYHKLRARVAGRRRYVELHVQYRSGTSLDQAHQLAHDLRDAIEAELGDAEALIHVEPESSVKEPAETGGPFRSG